MRSFAYRLFWTSLTVLFSCSIGTLSIAAEMSSGHDFTLGGANTTGRCAVCHMQTWSEVDASTQLLWRDGPRTDQRVSAVSGTYGSHPSRQWQVTKSCVSCHDGSVAAHNAPELARADSSGSSQTLGPISSLGTTHPVALVYDSELARRNPGLADPAVTSSGLGGTIAEDLLIDSRVECSSCHTVHDRVGDGRFLRIANTRGELCLTCHKL